MIIMAKVSVLKPDEVAEFSHVFREVVSETPYYSKEAKAAEIRQFSPREVRKKLDGGDYLFLISKMNGKIVGFSCGYYDAGLFWGDWFGVKKGFRGRHIALDLLDYRDAFLKRHGVHKIWNDCRTNNKESIGLLKKRGFRKIARMNRHWYKQDFYIWYKFL